MQNQDHQNCDSCFLHLIECGPLLFWKRIFTGVDCLVFSPRMLYSPLIINDDLIFPNTYPTDIYYFDTVYILKFEVKFYVKKNLCLGERFCQQKLACSVMVKRSICTTEGHKDIESLHTMTLMSISKVTQETGRHWVSRRLGVSSALVGYVAISCSKAFLCRFCVDAPMRSAMSVFV